ncbi:MAG TPA: hypothetical protein VF746_22940 [Longimicrobium sp.]|jgi:hypothetical protein
MSRPGILPLLAVLALPLAGCDNPGSPEIDRDACARAGLQQAAYAGDVQLGVGQAAELAPGASLCLVLPDASREYALAYLDTRAIEASRTAREPFRSDSFTVGVRDFQGGGPQPLRRLRAPAGGAPAFTGLPDGTDFLPVANVSAAASFHPALREAPWTQGEAFTLFDNLRQVDRPARVHRVYGGWLVAVAFEDEPQPTLPQTLAHLDAQWPLLSSTGLPLLRGIFGDLRPVTSGGSNQLLMVIRADLIDFGAAGVAFGAVVDDQVYSYIAVLPNDAHGVRNATGTGSLVFHEVTHTFQRSYLAAHAQNTPPSTSAGAARWGVEGGATLMQRELARRQAGIGATANYDWVSPGGTEVEEWYKRFAQPGRGELTAGYSAAAGFMMDLAQRRTAAGEGLDAALEEVMRGSIEGWFGHAVQGDFTGLAARMRSRLGSGWEPAEAVLQWTLSHAADDRTPSATFQNRAFRDAWNVQGGLGWEPHGTLAAGSGAWFEEKRLYGSSGFAYLAGRGGVYHLTAGVDGVRWMIVRIR